MRWVGEPAWGAVAGASLCILPTAGQGWVHSTSISRSIAATCASGVPVAAAEPMRLLPAQHAADDIEVHAQDRAHTAHPLQLGGVDWTEIAQRTGYLDARIAAMAVTAWTNCSPGSGTWRCAAITTPPRWC